MFYYLYPYAQSYRAIYRIVINTKAHTLTLFRNNNIYKTYKVAVGKPSTPTPKGTFKIINRAINRWSFWRKMVRLEYTLWGLWNPWYKQSFFNWEKRF